MQHLMTNKNDNCSHLFGPIFKKQFLECFFFINKLTAKFGMLFILSLPSVTTEEILWWRVVGRIAFKV
jgi:hypothetical protein